MEDFLIKMEAGRHGLNKGLITEPELFAKAINNIQRKTTYLIFAAPKTFKTKFVDSFFVLHPFLRNPHEDIEWDYFSFEVDRINKVADWIAFFFWHDYKIKYSANHILCRGDNKVKGEHWSMVEKILKDRIVPLMGNYDSKGKKISSGKLNFIEERDNPTGIRNYLLSKIKKEGEMLYEEYETEENGEIVSKKRLSGFNHAKPEKFRIVITDHVRKLRRERGFTMKENLDKYSDYQVQLRNLFGFTFVNIIHTNRSVSDTNRLSMNEGKYLTPMLDDVKDSGNLGEDLNVGISLLNPELYKIRNHFDYNVADWKGMYRSLHLIASRDTEAPKDMALIGDGANNLFKSLPSTNDREKLEEFKKIVNAYHKLGYGEVFEFPPRSS